MAVGCLANLVLGIDMTALHLAIPGLVEDVGPSANQILWIADAYGFALAGFLVTMGVVGDRIGRKRLFLLGTARVRGDVAADRVRVERGDADRGAGAARRRGRDDHAVHAVDHPAGVHRPRRNARRRSASAWAWARSASGWGRCSAV
ncbi:MFS transporter [Yinghuangia aomiensis]